MATHPERIYSTYRGKPSGLKLLKGFCLGAKLPTHAICFEGGDVNSYDPPEAQPETVCEAYILLSV